VRTLTNRLKRQHLAGADVGHLSRTTISGILNEVSGLRNHFRIILDDERSTTVMSRKEFRALLKLVSDTFQELGSLRAAVNEVVLNPLVANKLRDEALASDDAKARSDAKATGALGGWIAPLSKLWAGSSTESQSSKAPSPDLTPGLIRASSSKGRLQPPKIAPKLAPAVSASTTTVNVEFTNAGIRRAISTTPVPGETSIGTEERITPSPVIQNRPQLKGIFAGSSGTSTKPASNDPWVVLPHHGGGTIRRPAPTRFPSRDINKGAVNLSRNDQDPRHPTRRVSRMVDAVVDQHAVDDDDEEADEFPDNLLQRTLRPRGLSDSSVHSNALSFVNPVHRMVTPASLALTSPVESTAPGTVSGIGAAVTGLSGWLDRESLLQNIGKKMQNFRFATSSDQLRTKDLPDVGGGTTHNASVATNTSSPSGTPIASQAPLPSSPSRSPPKNIPKRSLSSLARRAEGSVSPTRRSPLSGGIGGAASSMTGLMPSLASWASSPRQALIENDEQDSPGRINQGQVYRKPSILREDATIGRTFRRGTGL
jgi:hypothetical protein